MGSKAGANKAGRYLGSQSTDNPPSMYACPTTHGRRAGRRAEARSVLLDVGRYMYVGQVPT